MNMEDQNMLDNKLNLTNNQLDSQTKIDAFDENCTLNVGDIAPNFITTVIDNQSNIKPLHLNQINQKIILFFYPKDNTPGCTLEAKAFSEKLKDFEALGVAVFGVSENQDQSHEKFIEKCNLNIPLIVDENRNIAKSYGLVKQKSLFGIKYTSISRSTFFIDANLKIINIWHDVSVFSHANEVFEYIKQYCKN